MEREIILRIKNPFLDSSKRAHPKYVINLFAHWLLTIDQSPSYGGPQLSHQNQMFTANSNRSQQITTRSQQIQHAAIPKDLKQSYKGPFQGSTLPLDHRL